MVLVVPPVPVLRGSFKELQTVVRAWRQGDVSSSHVIAKDYCHTWCCRNAEFWNNNAATHADIEKYAQDMVALAQQFLGDVKSSGNVGFKRERE